MHMHTHARSQRHAHRHRHTHTPHTHITHILSRCTTRLFSACFLSIFLVPSFSLRGAYDSDWCSQQFISLKEPYEKYRWYPAKGVSGVEERWLLCEGDKEDWRMGVLIAWCKAIVSFNRWLKTISVPFMSALMWAVFSLHFVTCWFKGSNRHCDVLYTVKPRVNHAMIRDGNWVGLLIFTGKDLTSMSKSLNSQQLQGSRSIVDLWPPYVGKGKAKE